MDRMEKPRTISRRSWRSAWTDPSKRAQSKPEDDEVPREIRYGYGLLCAIPFAYEYGFDFLVPLLLLWGVMQIVSVWKIKLRLWRGYLPTTVGWWVADLGSALGFAIVVT